MPFNYNIQPFHLERPLVILKPYYRYAIKKSSTQYYMVENRDVSISNTPYYFYDQVANWEDLGIIDIRNMRMSGFFRNRAENVQFVKNLAKIMRYVWFHYGVQGKATFVLYRLNSTTQQYELDSESDVDFSSAIDERLQFTAELMQTGVQELIKTNEEVIYEIPVTGPALKTVELAPMRMRGKTVFVTVDDENSSGNRIMDDYNWPAIMMHDDDYIKVLEAVDYKPITFMDPLAPTFIVGQQRNEVSGLGNYVGFLFASNLDLENVSLNFDLPIFLDNKAGSNTDFTLKIYQADNQARTGGGANWTPLHSSNTVSLAGGNSTTATFSINHTFDLAKDKVIHIILEKSNANACEYHWETQFVFNMTYEYFSSKYRVKGLDWFEIGKQLVNKMTNGAAVLNSSLLQQSIPYADNWDCDPSKLIMLSSASVKGKANPVIKISYKDYLNTTDILLCAGCGIEKSYDDNIVNIEKRLHYFKEKNGANDNLIAHLSSITKEWRIKPASDLMYSEIEIGFRALDDSDVNAKEEPNGILRFTTAYSKEPNKKSLISTVSASGFLMYQTYINYATDPSGDAGSDNENFVLQHTGNQVNGIYSALYPKDITGNYAIYNTTDGNYVVNPGLTPKRCLLRRAYYELGFFYGNDADSYVMKYASGEMNTEYGSKLAAGGIVVDEAENFNLTDYGTRLFYPYYLEVPTDSARNYRQAWEQNRYGIFSQTVNGVLLKGFPIESSDRNYKPRIQEYKQLLSKGNNLPLLIR